MLANHGDIDPRNLSGTTVQINLALGRPIELLTRLEPASVNLIVLHAPNTYSEEISEEEEKYLEIIGQGLCTLHPDGQLVILGRDSEVGLITLIAEQICPYLGLKCSIVNQTILIVTRKDTLSCS